MNAAVTELRPPESASRADPAKALIMIDILLRALSLRVLQVTALVMTCGLFCWAMHLQTMLAGVLAGVFGFGTLWPVLWIGHRSSGGT